MFYGVQRFIDMSAETRQWIPSGPILLAKYSFLFDWLTLLGNPSDSVIRRLEASRPKLRKYFWILT
jgi:hypothetical protein